LLASIPVFSICQADTGHRTILIIGDSLSAGYGIAENESWPALLQQRLTAEDYGYQVVNASISGDTTSGGLRRLPRALEIHKPDIVLIELGGNDGLRGTPIAVIRKNLETMVELALESGARVILAGMKMPPNYGLAYTDAYEKIYADLAEKYEVSLIPFFMKGVALDPGLLQQDQIHPNATGQSILLDNAWTILKPLLADAS